MAKLSQVLRDKKREKLIDKFAERRAELRAKIKDPSIAPEDKLPFVEALAQLPRNSSAVRRTRRCAVSGRSHGVYRKFGLSRIALRDLALAGDLPGVIKSSW